jgi:Fic family protein
MAWLHREVPFNDIPPLPPSAEIETTAVLKKSITANKFLAELKGSCLRLPNPGLLLNTVVLQESKDSSAIENIVTTQDALYQAILNPYEGIPSEVKEVLRYREAMYAGIEEMKKTGLIRSGLATNIMCKLRGITDQGFRNIPGTKLSNPQTNKVIYTPPEPGFIADKMADWERFVNEDETFDPLVKMALIHYQLEAIHPFSDGNGRTGRIVNVLYLLQQQLLTEPVLYHSSYIIQHKSDYYRCLREVTESDAWEQWVLFMLNAVIETSQRTLKFIEKMLALKDDTLKTIKTLSQKLPAYELNELLFSFPYIKVKTLLDKGMGTRPTVTGYLETLVAKGMLRPIKVGRENYYINHQLMDLLTNPGVE